jgi:twitching motility protein PilT
MAGFENDLSELVYELNRSTTVVKSQDRSRLDALLKQAVEQRASDVILVVGAAVTLRVNGQLAVVAGKALTDDDIRDLLLPLLSSAQAKELETSRSIDFCFVRPGSGRFRANLHYQRGTLAASLRVLPAQVPTVDSLHLPGVLMRLS